jgi:hypothetical protein
MITNKTPENLTLRSTEECRKEKRKKDFSENPSLLRKHGESSGDGIMRGYITFMVTVGALHVHHHKSREERWRTRARVACVEKENSVAA